MLTPGVASEFVAAEPEAATFWPAVITSRRELPAVALAPARRLPLTVETVVG